MKTRHRSNIIAAASLPAHLTATPRTGAAVNHRTPAGRARLAAFAVLGLILGVALPATGRAQLIGSLTEGPANAPYSYYLTIQFGNGRYYDFTLRSATASFTGTNFINTVAAGSQGTSFVLTVDQKFASGLGNYVNGITVNTDTNSGFTNNSYWNYWTGSATNPVAWTYSSVGEDSRTITPGQADGWVYEGNMAAPSATTFAVPEPSTWALAALGLTALGVGAIRRRQSPAGA